MSEDIAHFAEEYANLSKKRLLIELNAQMRTISYKEPPTEDEKEAAGNALWRQYRKRLANLFCGKDKENNRKMVTKLLDIGMVAFITQFGATIAGSNIGVGISLRVGAALAALLAVELTEMGLDRFCLAYGSDI